MLENQLYGAVTAQQQLVLPKTTIDVREANWVYIVNSAASAYLPVANAASPTVFDLNLDQVATSTVGANYFGLTYPQPQPVFYVGFNGYAAGGGTTTYNFAYEVSNDGITWKLIQQFPATTLADREWKYFNISTTPNYQYYRLRETVLSTFSIRQMVFSTSQQVIPLSRLNRDDYWNLPNKQFPSVRSLQYWFDRQIEPSMYLWPVPNNDFQMFQQQFMADLRFDSKHQFLTLTGRFHGLRSELGGAGDVRDFGRNHILRCSIKDNPHVASQRNLSDHVLWQKERHVDVAQVHKIQDFATACKDFAGLSNPILDSPGTR
jgi:hypothetical protein